MKAFIAVHMGAGNHSTDDIPLYSAWMKKACRKGQQVLQEGGTAADAVAATVAILEDCPISNAGIGSTLTNKGTVECDASVMDGRSLRYGAVGGVSGVANPVLLAHRVLQEQMRPLIGNLVPPSLMVGRGAREWGEQRGVATCDPRHLITGRSLEMHKDALRHVRKLKRRQKHLQCNGQPCDAGPDCGRPAGNGRPAGDSHPAGNSFSSGNSRSAGNSRPAFEVHLPSNYRLACDSRPAPEGQPSSEGSPASEGHPASQLQRTPVDSGAPARHPSSPDSPRSPHSKRRCPDPLQVGRLDTVGCVAVGAAGDVAAAVSSGGLLLKQPGRVGQAAVYGAGCWAEEDCGGSGCGVAACTTGCGEVLVSSMLALNSARLLGHSRDHDLPDLPRLLRPLVLENKFVAAHSRPMECGCLMLRHTPTDGSTDLYCYHTSASFGYAYMTASNSKPTVRFSRLPENKECRELALDCYSYYPPHDKRPSTPKDDRIACQNEVIVGEECASSPTASTTSDAASSSSCGKTLLVAHASLDENRSSSGMEEHLKESYAALNSSVCIKNAEETSIINSTEKKPLVTSQSLTPLNEDL